MFRIFLTLTLTLQATSLLFAQQTALNDYLVYSSFIKTEIIKKTKSVSIIIKQKNTTNSFSRLTDPIQLKEPQHLEELRFLTRDGNGNSIQSFDTGTQNLIIAFFASHAEETILQNQFLIPRVKVRLINSSPILNGTEQEWKKFYKENWRSGGIFEFSNIHYSEDGKLAVFYHSVFRRGLNAHGALVIMEIVDGEWKIKYHTNIWQA